MSGTRLYNRLTNNARLCKENRERRMAEGKCIWCGAKPPELDKTRCRECIDKDNNRRKKPRIKFSTFLINNN